MRDMQVSELLVVYRVTWMTFNGIAIGYELPCVNYMIGLKKLKIYVQTDLV